MERKINKQKAGVAIFADKIDFKATKIKKQRKILHKDKRINVTRRAKDPKHICTQYRNTQMYKTYKETWTPTQ